MSSAFHSVYLDPELCVGCSTCIKRCPTQAIRVRDGKAVIMEERCIDCGECIRACPKGAKKSVSDPLAVMDGFDLKFALPAPSLYAQFGSSYSPRDIRSALLALGFDGAFDVAWGAETLIEAIRERGASSDGPRPLLSSACPVVLRLVQQRYPSILPNIVPFLPPMEVAARELRARISANPETAKARAGLFFISPCTAKVTAVKNPLGYARSEIDAVLSFGDIYPALKRALAAGAALSDSPVSGAAKAQDAPNLARGMGWAMSDGELDALEIEGAVSVDGIGNVIELLEAVENGNLDDIPYVEALACPGGCVGGPMAVANPHVARTGIKALARKAKAAREPGKSSGTLYMDSALQPRPVSVLSRDLGQALAMAEELERQAALLPGLDCGACGAPDCHALAEDIVKGLATPEFCLVKTSRLRS
ncbi:MAG TPA: [Fe-Fe] hydrogenase large subunit C-terminal domain-containing protein [Rectinemataceae bacterium]